MIDVTKFKPCGDKLLIKPDPVENKSPGGIILPDSKVVDLMLATVVSVSDGFYGNEGFWVDMPKLFRAGDRIVYQHGTAAPIEHQKEYAFIQMAAVLAKEIKEGGQ